MRKNLIRFNEFSLKTIRIYDRHITPKNACASEKKYASNSLDEKVGNSAKNLNVVL